VDLDQVAGCTKTLLDDHDDLSALICNAGIMGGPYLVPAQGFELQMATNHFGHVALIAGLLPMTSGLSDSRTLCETNADGD
jgi:NAD(P)-dependent dehydrogenase (short-subunit alcohol dehydrogenase family)